MHHRILLDIKIIYPQRLKKWVLFRPNQILAQVPELFWDTAGWSTTAEKPYPVTETGNQQRWCKGLLLHHWHTEKMTGQQLSQSYCCCEEEEAEEAAVADECVDLMNQASASVAISFCSAVSIFCGLSFLKILKSQQHQQHQLHHNSLLHSLHGFN